MKEQLEILKALGMKPKEAMLFIREIAATWYEEAHLQTSMEGYIAEYVSPSFDTIFNEKIGN